MWKRLTLLIQLFRDSFSKRVCNLCEGNGFWSTIEGEQQCPWCRGEGKL